VNRQSALSLIDPGLKNVFEKARFLSCLNADIKAYEKNRIEQNTVLKKTERPAENNGMS